MKSGTTYHENDHLFNTVVIVIFSTSNTVFATFLTSFTFFSVHNTIYISSNQKCVMMIMTTRQKHHTYSVQKKVIERSKAKVPVLLISVRQWIDKPKRVLYCTLFFFTTYPTSFALVWMNTHLLIYTLKIMAKTTCWLRPTVSCIYIVSLYMAVTSISVSIVEYSILAFNSLMKC